MVVGSNLTLSNIFNWCELQALTMGYLEATPSRGVIKQHVKILAVTVDGEMAHFEND